MKKIIKKLQRGFTIVELVIVIAVIAILAAVLIPTFANLINSAEESNDMVLVSNINTIVTSYDTVGEIDKVTTQDNDKNDVSVYNIATAIKAVSENGYDVSKLTPTSESGDIVYNASTNNFLYYTDDFTELAYGTEPKTGEVLVVVDSNLQRVALAQSSSLLSGLTVQYCVYTTYDTGANIDNSDITVWLYTEGGSVTINLAGGTVYHYGVAETVAIKEVATESYHLYGAVEEITLDKGHVELAESAVCTTVTSTSETDTIITVVGEKSNLNLVGTFATYYTKTSDTAETSEALSKDDFAAASGVILEGTAASNPYMLSTYDDLTNSTTGINAKSNTTTTTYFKLANDITLTGVVSISCMVDLDLNGYTITAATDKIRAFVVSGVTGKTYADFTIRDSRGGGKICATGTNTANSTAQGKQVIAITCTYAKLTLESGSICAIDSTGLDSIVGTTTTDTQFIMNGGSVYADDSTLAEGLVYLTNNAKFTMNGGDLYAMNKTSTKSLVYVTPLKDSMTSTFAMNDGNIYAKNSTVTNGLVCLYVNGYQRDAEFNMYDGELTVDSTVKSGSSYTPAIAVYSTYGGANPKVNIYGGTITAFNFCIAGNGGNDYNYGISYITVDGGTLISEYDFAIYAPQPVYIYIKSGTVQGGAGAICMNRGTLEISGGKLICENSGETGNKSDGTSGVDNCVVNLGAEYDAVACTITGGTLTTNGSAKVITIGTSASINNVTLSVTKVTVNSTEYTAINDAYVTVADGYTLSESDGVYTYSAS